MRFITETIQRIGREGLTRPSYRGATNRYRPRNYTRVTQHRPRGCIRGEVRSINTYNANQQAEQQEKYNEANTLQTNQDQTEKDMHYQTTQSADTVPSNESNSNNSNYYGGGGGSNDSSNTGEVLGAAALGAVCGMAVGSMMKSASQPAAPPPNPYGYYPPPNPYGYYPPPPPPPPGYQPYYNGSQVVYAPPPPPSSAPLF